MLYQVVLARSVRRCIMDKFFNCIKLVIAGEDDFSRGMLHFLLLAMLVHNERDGGLFLPHDIALKDSQEYIPTQHFLP